jgi:hypothetical protein
VCRDGAREPDVGEPGGDGGANLVGEVGLRGAVRRPCCDDDAAAGEPDPRGVHAVDGGGARQGVDEAAAHDTGGASGSRFGGRGECEHCRGAGHDRDDDQDQPGERGQHSGGEHERVGAARCPLRRVTAAPTSGG